jgi:hypothetical protein
MTFVRLPASDLNYHLRFSQDATVEMYEQRRHLNLRVLRKPDPDGQGTQLVLDGETSVIDDLSLDHSNRVAQFRGELHYSALCGSAGGIDAGTLTFTGGTLSPAVFSLPATYNLPATYIVTSATPTLSMTGKGVTSTSTISSGSGTEVTTETSLNLNLEYSTQTTTVRSIGVTDSALAAPLFRMIAQDPAAMVTVTYTGCGLHT